MIKLIFNYILCIVSIFFFTGCAGFFVVSDSFQNQNIESYRKKAVVFEKNEEWQMALYCWKMVDSLSTQGKEAAIKISDLTAHIKQQSEKHVNNGMELYKNDELKQARSEFYLAVKIDPDNDKAVTYLKNILKGEKYKTTGMILKDSDGAIEDRKGDDLRGDDKKKALGTKPVNLKPEFRKPEIDFEAKLAQGAAFLKAGQFDDAIRISEEILKHVPLNKKAFDLANASYYQKGVMLDIQKEYLKSLDMFCKVDSEYKDVKQKVALQRKVIKDLADQYYKTGVKFYIDEKIQNAIMEWRKTLAFDPDHEEAKRDLSKAIEILEKLDRVQ